MWERFNIAGQQAMQQGRLLDAESQFKLAIQEAEKEGVKAPQLALSLNNLANCFRQQGKFADAEPIYKRCIQVKEGQVGPLHIEMVPFLENYAKMLRASGREHEADKVENKARAIFAKN